MKTLILALMLVAVPVAAIATVIFLINGNWIAAAIAAGVMIVCAFPFRSIRIRFGGKHRQ